jgi:hypothetical protein
MEGQQCHQFQVVNVSQIDIYAKLSASDGQKKSVDLHFGKNMSKMVRRELKNA